MAISICSYSFHRMLKAGEQDMFSYMQTCKNLGASYLEPWNGHFATPGQALGEPPELSNPGHAAYIKKVKETAEALDMPFGCIAVDGAHIYEASEEARRANRERASKWLEVAAYLQAEQVRIDSGYRGEDWPNDVFDMIVAGYEDVIAEATEKGVNVIIENHWGPSQHPEPLIKLLKTVKDLGLLFDTHNWAEGKQEEGWEACAKYAKAVHIKTFSFDAEGNDPTVDLSKAFRLLKDSGYGGIWGIESVPTDGDELGAAEKTISLVRKEVDRAFS